MNAERRPTNAPDVFSLIGIVIFCSALIGTILPGVVAWRADVFSQNLNMAGATAFFSSANPFMWLWTVVYASCGTLCVLLAFLTPVLQLPEVQQHFPGWILTLITAHAAPPKQ